MSHVIRRSVLLAGVLALMLRGDSTAKAQIRPYWPGHGTSRYYNPYAQVPWMPLPQPAIPINPNWWVAPGLTLNQAAYNQSVMNYAAFANTPYQWYNPFITRVRYANFAPYYNYYPYMNPYYNTFANPYAGFAYGGVYMNPYAFIYGGY